MSASGLWRNGDFLKFWGGEAVSRLGTQVSLLALPLIAIISLHASATEVGILGAAQVAPVLVITPFAGVWMDRRLRRRPLIGANLGRGLLIGAIPILYAADSLSMTGLDVIAFAAGSLTAVFEVGYLAYVPSLVRRSELIDANSKLMGSFSAAQVGGPGLGGVLVQLLTAPVAVAADALSYLVAAAGLLAIRNREPPMPKPLERRVLWSEIAEGLRVTFGDAFLRPLLLEAAWFNFFERVMLTVFLVYAARDLHFSPGAIGAVITLGGAGALVGSFLAARVGRRLGVGGALIAGMALASLSPLLIPAAGGTESATYALLGAGFLLYGGGLAVFNVHAIAFRQAVAPNHVLGRVNASYRLATFGTIPIGAAAGGAAADLIGLRTVLVLAAASMVLGAAAFALSTVARLREVPAPVDA